MKMTLFVSALALAAFAPAWGQGKGGGGGGTVGAIVIDQARAEAGGVTPGDAPGFPVTLSVPGSYRLTGNLTVSDANTTAIVISAPNVTLDLGGFTILGPVVCTLNISSLVCNVTGTGDGVRVVMASYNNRAGIAVTNGTIRGMGRHGVHSNSSFDGIRVEQIFAIENGRDGFVVNGGSIKDSHALLNGTNGISGNNLLLIGNVVRANGVTGVMVNFGSAGVHNVIQGNPTEVSSGGMRNLGPNLCGTSLCP